MPFQRQSAGNTSTIRVLSSFALTCQVNRTEYTLTTQDGDPVVSVMRSRKACRAWKAGGRQEAVGSKTVAGLGADIPQTDPLHPSEAATFAAFRDCGLVFNNGKECHENLEMSRLRKDNGNQLRLAGRTWRAGL